MANLFVPNSAIVRLIWEAGTGGQMVNVLGATKGAAVINQTLANNLGTAIKSALTSSGIISKLHPTVQLVNVGVRDYSSPNQAEFIDTGGPVTGTGTGDPLPRGAALVITLRTALAGQRYRGRVFLGGFLEADNDTGALASAGLGTAAINFITAVQGAMNSNGLGLAVLSRPADQKQTITTVTDTGGNSQEHTHTSKARPGAITPVTGLQLRNLIWDSQRRRTSAGGASTLMRNEFFVDLSS